MRDLEKLGQLDVEGLFIPLAVVTALALVLAFGRPAGKVTEDAMRNRVVDFKSTIVV